MTERPPLIGDIIRTAMEEARRQTHALYGIRSKKSESRARWVVWRGLKIKRKMNLADIAWRSGNYNHTSVSYGLARLDELLLEDGELYDIADRIADMIPPRLPPRGDTPPSPGITRYPAAPGLEDCTQ